MGEMGNSGRREWENCSLSTPMFNPFAKYRRKPEVIIINGIEVPKPLRIAPTVGTPYFCVHIIAGSIVIQSKWRDCDWDRRALSCGLCHLTEGAATKHVEALLSFTKVQD